ncbi:hypothetical protein PACTADRAFT_47588 [Pachysolen tannophilus NRRL Y-2460]|uniref:CRAL-TRIO domain-containing protein n=1 Tax=Pachysolen tannophilus NRRL Y-2460 TaxID=669874 RepID=A0A1E4U161_PACTA|nr:hypothetical protein PACTADRAFT_47588 [Pachysolen tannophilus NRRL Y-2460]
MSSSSRILYRSDTYEPETGLPIYIFDSNFLPPTFLDGNDNNGDILLLETLLDKIDGKFVLIMFSSGFKNSTDDLLPLKLVRLFKLIPNDKKEFLIKVYIVHHNWLIKSILDLLNNFMMKQNRGNNLIIIHCQNISNLSRYLDITKLNISLFVYLYDYTLENNIIVPIHLDKIFQNSITNLNPQTLTIFKKILNKLVDYLDQGNFSIQSLIKNLSINDNDNSKLLSFKILKDCIKRNQLLNLSDWKFNDIFQILLKFLSDLNEIDEPLLLIDYFVEFEKNGNDDLSELVNKLLNHQYYNNQNNISSTSSLFNGKNENNSNNNNNNNNNNYTTFYNNKYIIVKVFKIFHSLINYSSNSENEKQLLILEISKRLFNINGNIEGDVSSNFKIFYHIMKKLLLDGFHLLDSIHQLPISRTPKIDEDEMIEFNITELNNNSSDLIDLSKDDNTNTYNNNNNGKSLLKTKKSSINNRELYLHRFRSISDFQNKNKDNNNDRRIALDELTSSNLNIIEVDNAMTDFYEFDSNDVDFDDNFEQDEDSLGLDFQKPTLRGGSRHVSLSSTTSTTSSGYYSEANLNHKKPVIRGKKVEKLTKFYEEKMDLLS